MDMFDTCGLIHIDSMCIIMYIHNIWYTSKRKLTHGKMCRLCRLPHALAI